jgi:protein gp37
VSVENQEEADRRIPILLATPAKLRWLSVESLLEAVNLRPHLARLDWIVCSGEWHDSWRPMEFVWAETIRDDCAEFGVPFFMKQVAALRQPMT